MALATTAGVLSCLLCTRTIITTLFQEHDTLIRAISGLLAGILIAAAPVFSSLSDGRRRHQIRIDDENIKISLLALSLYALFDIVTNPHFIWVIFPLLGWTVSSVLLSQSLHEPEDHSERRHIDRHGRITVTKTRSKSDITAQRDHESNIKLKASVINEGKAFLVNRDDHTSSNIRSSSNFPTRATTTRNNLNDDVTVLPTNRTTKPGSPHVKFAETTSRHRHKTNYEILPNRHRRTLFEDVIESPNASPVAAPVTLLPLTATNVRRISQSPKHLDDIEENVALSDNLTYLTFHTAESTFSESESSETDSQYTLARTAQSAVSSTTTKASLAFGRELVLYEGPSNEGERLYEPSFDEESEEEEEEVDNTAIPYPHETAEYEPHLIPQDYISQTYVRVEKFVSEVDGTELGEQIEVMMPDEPPSDKTQLRNQKKYLETLLAYEPSETSSSTTVRLSELEGNMKAIDRRADEYRKQSLEAKQKISALGEKRKIALKNSRSNEAFRIKCTMQEYQKEADRADKKAAKLYFRARNKPGTSTIDVHSLKKEEALKAVETALREVQLRGGHQLRVIVGQGLHSKNGRAILKPSVISAFRAQEMRVFESANNPGVLFINMS